MPTGTIKWFSDEKGLPDSSHLMMAQGRLRPPLDRIRPTGFAPWPRAKGENYGSPKGADSATLPSRPSEPGEAVRNGRPGRQVFANSLSRGPGQE